VWYRHNRPVFPAPLRAVAAFSGRSAGSPSCRGYNCLDDRIPLVRSERILRLPPAVPFCSVRLVFTELTDCRRSRPQTPHCSIRPLIIRMATTLCSTNAAVLSPPPRSHRPQCSVKLIPAHNHRQLGTILELTPRIRPPKIRCGPRDRFHFLDAIHERLVSCRPPLKCELFPIA